MKLKYYLRGMGIGIILTAIVMGFALGGRKTTISDAEVIERAKALGMVDASGVLSQTVETPEALETNEEDQTTNAVEEISNDSSASSTTLDKEGKEISEEDDQTVALASQPVSEVAKEEKKGEDKKSEESKFSEDASKQASSSATEATSVQKEEVKPAETKKEDTKTEETKPADTKTAETKKEEQKQEETKNEQTAQASSESVLGSTTSVTKTVTIPGGLGSEQVSNILQREGIVDSAYSFNQYLCDKKMDRKIRSGVKTIPAGSSYEDIARIICKE